MKKDVLYSVTANITIQGPRVLRLLEYQNDFVLFDVIGFEHQVFIKDFRNKSLTATANLNDNAQNFAYEFRAPAEITIEQQSDEILLITLKDTNNVQPEYMLWIAIGLEDLLPLYDYEFQHIAQFTQDSLAIVALYRRPPTAYQFYEESPDSSSTSSRRRGMRISSSVY